jgi:hypothetical protein
MKTAEFKARALTLVPTTDPNNTAFTQITEDLGEGWWRLTTNWTDPAMLEAHIYYQPELKKNRQMNYGVWCYKHVGQDWDIGKTYRFW